MWSSRLFWKLLLAYGALYVVFGVLYLAVVARQQRDLLIDQLRERLDSTALLLRSQALDRLAHHQGDTLQPLVVELGRKTRMRLTLVDATGKVLADSDEAPERMRDHANRDELRQAAATGRGESIRQSPTLGKRMFYVALPLRQQDQLQGFVRVAAALDVIDARIKELDRRLLWITLGAGLLLAPLSYLLVGRIIHPLAQLTAAARSITSGDYAQRVRISSRDELGELGSAFNLMQQELQGRINQLQEHGNRMATVLGGMVEGVIAVDHQQRVLLANPASRTLLDVTLKDVVGRSLMEVARSREVQQIFLDALRADEPCAREITITTGQRRNLKILAARLHGAPSPGVVMVLHDVSELRRLENLRRDFVANVSHELKTPLATIKACAETLRLGALNDPEHNLAFVGRIEDQAHRLHQLILDLLQLARVETGREAFEFGCVPLSEIASDCLARHADAAAHSGITLALEPAAEELDLWADASGVQTILDNLITNAIKYTPGGGRVTLRWARDGSFARLEVIDTGIGIAARDQERVFERFYRVDRARSRELGGTGLGLSIVKHLAQAFGGEVGLDSELGRGSTFRVRLPLAAPQSVAAVGDGRLEC